MFKPGQSGNPGGRAKNPFGKHIREKTKDGEEIVDRVLKLFRKTKKENVILWCAEWLRDTGWGKPVQGVYSADGEGNENPFLITFQPIVPPKAKR